jgi:hypothetical protein
MRKQPGKHLVSASACIPADPERVYAVIADYREGHPRILPPQFSGSTIEKGGVGAGTAIRFQMRVLGRTQSFRAAITEPEPGRVLVETYLDSNGVVTSFQVDPGPVKGQSQVTITTELALRSGVLGAIERFMATRYLRPIYRKELALLAAVAIMAPQPTHSLPGHY